MKKFNQLWRVAVVFFGDSVGALVVFAIMLGGVRGLHFLGHAIANGLPSAYLLFVDALEAIAFGADFYVSMSWVILSGAKAIKEIKNILDEA